MLEKKMKLRKKKIALGQSFTLYPGPRILGPGAKLRSAGFWTWWPFQRKHSGGQTCGVTGERQVTHFKDRARIPSVSWFSGPAQSRSREMGDAQSALKYSQEASRNLISLPVLAAGKLAVRKKGHQTRGGWVTLSKGHGHPSPNSSKSPSN